MDAKVETDNGRISGGAGHPDSDELRRLFELSSDLLAIFTREGRFCAVNPAWKRVLGWSPSELLERSVADFIHPEDLLPTEQLAALADRNPPEVANFENRYRAKDGSYRWLLWSASRSDGHWYAVAKDVTERKALERRAVTDPLTRLPNRLALTDHLRSLMAADGSIVVAFIDVDSFKAVNDDYGHAVGDQLLQSIGARLAKTMRASDLVARIGGEEFVAAVNAPGEPEGVGALAERLLEPFSTPFVLGEERIIVSVSIGLSCGGSQSTPEELIREADVAMYRVKERGGGSWALFDEQMRAEVRERLSLAIELRHASEREELELHYQPIIGLESETPVGCEALLRWRRGDGQLIAPGRFIPLAEHDGQIIPIGAWVLREACRQASEWRRAGLGGTISVNVSSHQLSGDDLPARVDQVLRDVGLPAQSLCLELTESSLVEDLEATAPALERLRRMGVRIAIDDFGSGASSLGYLRGLPVDVVKIDRSFVADLPGSSEDQAIFSGIVTLAEKLGASAIAEGIERDEQHWRVRELGCDLAQGFLYQRPVPADQVELGGLSSGLERGIGDPFVIREFMRQIGIPARMGP